MRKVIRALKKRFFLKKVRETINPYDAITFDTPKKLQEGGFQFLGRFIEPSMLETFSNSFAIDPITRITGQYIFERKLIEAVSSHLRISCNDVFEKIFKKNEIILCADLLNASSMNQMPILVFAKAK